MTTTQLSYTAKVGERVEKVIPCGNIQKPDAPLDGKTTTALSYMTPGNVDQFGSFKPYSTYCRWKKKPI